MLQFCALCILQITQYKLFFQFVYCIRRLLQRNPLGLLGRLCTEQTPYGYRCVLQPRGSLHLKCNKKFEFGKNTEIEIFSIMHARGGSKDAWVWVLFLPNPFSVTNAYIGAMAAYFSVIGLGKWQVWIK